MKAQIFCDASHPELDDLFDVEGIDLEACKALARAGCVIRLGEPVEGEWIYVDEIDEPHWMIRHGDYGDIAICLEVM